MAYKIRESSFKWFGNIKHWLLDYLVKRMDVLYSMYVKNNRDRLNKTWLISTKTKLILLELNESMSINWLQWRKVYVTNPM